MDFTNMKLGRQWVSLSVAVWAVSVFLTAVEPSIGVFTYAVAAGMLLYGIGLGIYNTVTQGRK